MTRIRWFCSVHAYCFSEVGSEIAVCPMDFQSGFFSAFREKWSQAGQLLRWKIKENHVSPVDFPLPEMIDQACRSQSLRRHVEVGATRDMPSEHDPKISQVTKMSKSLGIGTTWNHQRVPLEVESLVWLDAFEHLWTFNANAISSISTRCRRASTSLHKQLGVEARIEIHRKLSVCLGKACLQNTSSSVEGCNVLEYNIFIYNML